MATSILRNARPLWAVLFATALLVSACGGDSTPTAPSGEEALDGSQDLSQLDDRAADGTGDAPGIAPGEPNPAAPLTSVDGLVQQLQGLGADVTYDTDPLEEGLFGTAAHVLRVDGHEVRAFVYDSVEDLKADAARISPDAGMLGDTPVRWMEAPRFYARGSVMVLYVGVEERVIETLETLLGQPFAGQGGPGFIDPDDPGTGLAQMREPALLVVGTDEELQRLRPFLSEEGSRLADGADLSQDYVVAVFRGAMPTAGYAIAIEAVDVDEAGLNVVSVSLRDPGAEDLVAQVITYPAAVRVVPRSQVGAADAWVARTGDGQVLARFADGITSPGSGGIVPPDGSVVDPIPVEPDGGIGDGADPLPVDPGSDPAVSEKPHIAGTIAESEALDATDSRILTRFLVRGDGSTGYDQAWVEVLQETIITFDGESFAPPTLADLAPGRRVQVVFSGPVRESYPVQAVAGQIVILR